jgi:hypothetical protein
MSIIFSVLLYDCPHGFLRRFSLYDDRKKLFPSYSSLYRYYIYIIFYINKLNTMTIRIFLTYDEKPFKAMLAKNYSLRHSVKNTIISQ